MSHLMEIIKKNLMKKQAGGTIAMKATGIVRRIDDLGRVVIPKEIRKTMRINEGSPMEIFTDRQGEIILKKYSPIGEMSLFAKEYAEVLAQTTGMLACITDRDQVVAASGQGSKELTGKSITRELESLITGREGKCFRPGEKNKILISESQKELVGSEIIQPVLAGGDGIGSVILISKDQNNRFGDSERMLVQTAAGFLGRQMEQ